MKVDGERILEIIYTLLAPPESTASNRISPLDHHHNHLPSTHMAAGGLRSKMKIGAYKETTWELIAWTIIRIIFIVMVIAEIVLTILVYTQRKVVLHVSLDHQHKDGARFPNVLLCPAQPVNMSYTPKDLTATTQLRDFVLGHVIPSRIAKTTADIGTFDNATLAAITQILKEKAAENLTYTSELLPLYRSYGYQCSAVVKSCQLNHELATPVDCCAHADVVPTYYGPCLFLKLETLPAKQHTAGQVGGLAINLQVSNIKSVIGNVNPGNLPLPALQRFDMYLVDRWAYYPRAGTTVLRSGFEYYVNLRSSRSYLMGKRKREREDEDENWDENWEREFKEYNRRSRAGDVVGQYVLGDLEEPPSINQRRNCPFQCYSTVIAELCGCVPFYTWLGVGGEMKVSSATNPKPGTIPACNAHQTIDCVRAAAVNATTQLATNIDGVKNDEFVDTLTNSTDSSASTTLKSKARKIWEDLKQTWWKLGYREPKDCVTHCQAGDVVTTYEPYVSSLPLYPESTDPENVIETKVNLAYSATVMTVNRETYSMTVSEMLWVMGTNVAIWVVLYYILRCVYEFLKKACQLNKKNSAQVQSASATINPPLPAGQPNGTNLAAQRAGSGGNNSRPQTSNSRPGTQNYQRPPLDGAIEARPRVISPGYDRPMMPPPANPSGLPPIQHARVDLN